MREGCSYARRTNKNEVATPETRRSRAGIEDEMRAQMLLKDPKMLENYLRVGFKVMMERCRRPPRL